MRYETDKELLDDIARRARKFLEPYIYQGLAYDDQDAQELWQILRSDKKLKSANNTSVAKKRTIKKTLREPSSVDFIAFFEDYGKGLREALGLANPIPIERLGEELLKIDSQIQKGEKWKNEWISAFYPIDLTRGRTPRLGMWLLNLVKLPNVPLFADDDSIRTQDAIYNITHLLQCHPALALAHLLCDIPVNKDVVTVIITGFGQISVSARGPEVPIWLIQAMYKMGRTAWLYLKTNRFMLSAKPRGTSKRVGVLREFIKQNRKLRWKRLWEKWNTMHPDWKYASINSMRVTFYRTRSQVITVRIRNKSANNQEEAENEAKS
jgi:hypothetical protein